MISKSWNLKDSLVKDGKYKHNKTFDFIGLYQSAEETNTNLIEHRESGASINGEISCASQSNVETDTPKRYRSPSKKKNKSEPVDISHIVMDGQSLVAGLDPTTGRRSSVDYARGTSTPYSTAKILSSQSKQVKSIMKTSSIDDDPMEEPSYASLNPKKRNKSVSFMLEEKEEVAIKKTKSNDSIKKSKKLNPGYSKDEIRNLKKVKKSRQAEKENAGNVNVETEESASQTIDSKPKKTKSKHEKIYMMTDATVSASEGQTEQNNQEYLRRKIKKLKKQKKGEARSEPTESSSIDKEGVTVEPKTKKNKRMKHAKPVKTTDTTETEEEPAKKICKKENKADVIAEDLENLSIGDNTHTLTNLLDEMTVVDKNKRKKNKHKHKKEKSQKSVSVSSNDTADVEKSEEVKEKVKWNKRKWNKDKKGNVNEIILQQSVVIGNLPLKLILHFKTLLAEHFGKLGAIKNIGIAEVYPAEEPKPVFTTTILFESEAAATKALEEDNTLLEGARLRVRRPLPPTETTLAVRSYGELNDQSLSSAFSSAGRIRRIRYLIKGRRAMATAFIEFDGPEAVERAITMAGDVKIGAKKVHVSKFEYRKKDKKPKAKSESANEGDSEDSND